MQFWPTESTRNSLQDVFMILTQSLIRKVWHNCNVIRHFWFFRHCLHSIPGTAQYVHWEILHKHLEQPPNDGPASCSYGLICRVVSHHVPVGSHLRGRGWDCGCGCGAVADGIQGQYLFFNLAGVFASVVFQELHSMCIGRSSISVWSNHLMIGMHPAHMGLSAVVVVAFWRRNWRLGSLIWGLTPILSEINSTCSRERGPRSGWPCFYSPPRYSHWCLVFII